MGKFRNFVSSKSGVFAITAVVIVILGLTIGLTLWAVLRSDDSYTCDSCEYQIRINQVGYVADDDAKQAIFMTPTEIDGEFNFNVISSLDQQVVLSKTFSSVDLKDCYWSDNYPYTYALDFTELTAIGKFSIQVNDDSNLTVATSYEFQIGASIGSLFHGFLGDSLFYFIAQRDGDMVDNQVMNRQPSHLNDRSAFVYQAPKYNDDGVLLPSSLTKIGGPVDVEGGWFDAGDYIKLVETSSYTLLMMELAARDNLASLNTTEAQLLLDEIEFGLTWFFKMWDNSTRTLYYQVGIGDGNDDITGDHDLWRLPEEDDDIDLSENPEQYYIKYRPVFKMGPGNLSPNLGGRVAALFAVCDELFYSRNQTLANICHSYARTVYADIDTSDTTLVSTVPFDYYPEEEWRDDVSMGAIQIFRSFWNRNQGGSAEALLRLCDAIHYMDAYLSEREVDDRESLTVYDISALSHYEIYKVLDSSGYSCSGENSETVMNAAIEDFDQRLSAAVETSDSDCFGLGVDPTEGSDVPPYVFGLWALADMYEEMTGSDKYSEFAKKQIDWLFGNNAWGFSMVVGTGDQNFHCLQHQVANLNPSLTLFGAVTSAFVDTKEIDEESLPDGALSCKGLGGSYEELESDSGQTMVDNAAVYQSTEPADDYSVIALYMFARSSVVQ